MSSLGRHEARPAPAASKRNSGTSGAHAIATSSSGPSWIFPRPWPENAKGVSGPPVNRADKEESVTAPTGRHAPSEAVKSRLNRLSSRARSIANQASPRSGNSSLPPNTASEFPVAASIRMLPNTRATRSLAGRGRSGRTGCRDAASASSATMAPVPSKAASAAPKTAVFSGDPSGLLAAHASSSRAIRKGTHHALPAAAALVSCRVHSGREA